VALLCADSLEAVTDQELQDKARTIIIFMPQYCIETCEQVMDGAGSILITLVVNLISEKRN
jgi:hypothetical protein